MRTDREELLDCIRDISEAYPDMRLAQLICNLVSSSGLTKPEAVWDAEDADILPAARSLAEHLRIRNSTAESLASGVAYEVGNP